MFGIDRTLGDEGDVFWEGLRLDARNGFGRVLGVELMDVEEEAEEIDGLTLPLWATRWLRLTWMMA